VNRRAVPLLALLLALAPSACGREGQAASTLTREQFVRANVAMRSVPDTATNAKQMRLDSMTKHGASPGRLRLFVRANGDNLRMLSEAYLEIADSVDRRATRRGELSSGDGTVPVSPEDQRFRDSMSRIFRERARVRDEPPPPDAGALPPPDRVAPRPVRVVPPPPRNAPPPRTEATRAMVKRLPGTAPADSARPKP
jgi:hypothetical protein